MDNIKQLDQSYVAHTYARFPVTLTGGQGALLTGDDGKQYIDMGSGIGVNAFGACDAQWLEAVTHQAAALQHTSNLYYTEPCAKLAAMLCQRTGMQEVFFSNSGAEANECAIKVARKYGAEQLGPEHFTVLTLKNSFHGRTLATLAATGQEVFHKDFLPLTPGFVYGESGDLEGIRKILDEVPCCAVLLEMIQGEGGVLVQDKAFVQGLAQLASEHKLLLMVDEVQTGNGRTGKLFSYMHYGIQPDVVTTAKGLGGGLPLGAVLLGGKAAGVLTPGSHGSTFGGNPVCCAGAISILKRLDDTLLAEVTAKGEWIRAQLEGAPGVRSVSGLGLMLGIETERDPGQVLADCQALGVLPLRAKNKLRLLPPLNIPNDLLEQAVTIIKEVCAK
ncbi:MAG: acetylornithine transaminase [Fournierella sp.]|uniref:acetylornithine transaminase n=1 Tax=Allofournierella sp. TaxID=1940256 RepID=UPI002A80EBE8|nr:acetylornithine transaminase [Fournierella sp.]MDY4167030.1 acetylornithine transaminase [Fournierella sp.]